MKVAFMQYWWVIFVFVMVLKKDLILKSRSLNWHWERIDNYKNNSSKNKFF